MEVADEQGLLVVNLENCISNTADEQVVKGDCVYAVAVTSNTCSNESEAVIQIPVSVHCSEEAQQYATVAQLEEEQLTATTQHYNEVQTHHYSQIEIEEHLPCLNADGGTDSNDQDVDVIDLEEQVSLPLGLNRGQHNDTDSAYYTEIYNYLASQAVPDGATESYKKILKKRSHNYKIMEDTLYYGQKQPKRVITERTQQREILKGVHIEEGTGVHLGLKKMYLAIDQFYFWKGLYVDVANFVRQCKQCSETTEIRTSESEQPQQSELAKDGDNSGKDKNTESGNTCKVWQKVELKLYGPYPKTVLQNEFIITIADPFSHWIVARPVSGSDHASHIADFIYKTFCTFGFAKCSVVGVPQEVLETAQSKYQECVSRLRDTLLTCGVMLPQLTSTCGSTAHSLLVFLLENLSQCSWVGKLLDEFVEANPCAWDLELERFLFEYCTTAGGESSSPFTAMFGRSPVSYLEEDKENHNVIDKEKPAEVLSKRRRLQSSILQCRHCEEAFTSKISFRIHQRKHTDEARRQGTLEGQEPLGSGAERDKRLLRRTALKQRQRLFKQDDKNIDHIKPSDNCQSEKLPVEDSLYSDNEMTNSASSLSDIGVFSLDSDNVQNVSIPTSPHHDSAMNFQEETLQSNGNIQFRILESNPNSKQLGVVEEMESYVQDLRHTGDVSIVVCTETDVSDTLQTSNKETDGSYAHELNQIDSSGLQLEVVNYPVEASSWNENQCAEVPIKAHKRSAISAEKDSTGVFHCGICGQIFLNRKRLITHIEQHSNPLLKCTLCSYTTKSSSLLEYHHNIHTGKFKCKICNKLFTRKIYLKYHHKDVHLKTRRRLHDCEECNARFMSLSGLKVHIQTAHEPLKTYSCSLCKYIGKSTNSLAAHMLRSHRKKYKCNICDYSSLTQGGLDKHVRIYHNPDDRQYACKHCSYRGLKRRQLLDHENIVHNQDKSKHVCPVCKKSFRTQVLMKHHLPAHSDKHFYSCRRCSYTTRYRQTFHLHLKHSHPGESFKNLCNGPSEADFEAIINTALKTLEPFPSSHEHSMEINYTQAPVEDADPLEITDLSEHSISQSIPCPSRDAENCCEVSKTNQIMSEYESLQQTETATNTELIESALGNSVQKLNTENVESDQAVTVIDGSGLTSDEVQTIVSLAGDLSGGKQEVHHLVTLSGTDTEKTLFPLSAFKIEDRKVHQVVTLVEGLSSITETNQHAVSLLGNVMQHKAHEHSTVTHVSLTGSNDPHQENLVILPLGDSKVAIIQNDSFSNSHLVVNEQTPLLSFVPQQIELIQQQPEESINQVTIYRLDQ